jgi:AcrR family transcriptional regulator
MASNTRQRLIETSTARFYRDGFRNAGLDQILSDVGISKTAFYKHFSSKDDLMLAVLDEHDRWFRELFMQMIEQHGGTEPLGQLHALMDVVRQIIESEDFHGCIFINAAMEFPLAHDPAHAAAAKNKQAIEMIVREIAAKAGAKEPAALAAELCLIIEGAYVTFSVTRNPQTVEIARSVAKGAIEKHVKKRGKPRRAAPAR